MAVDILNFSLRFQSTHPRIQFIICSTIEMGSNILACQRQHNQKAQIIVKQMELYKWRQQNIHKCIPWVSMVNESQVRQQEVLRQFLEKYKQKESISVVELTEQIQGIAENGQQRLTFEKYACSLQEIECVLEIQELIYVIKTLLTAFQEIKRKFKTIVIEKECCFVTLKGEVRGWINSNPKSNELDIHKGYSYYHERDYKLTIQRIAAIAKTTAVSSTQNGCFLAQFQKYITSLSLRNDIFEFCRNWLNQYSQRQQISNASNIKGGLMRVKTLDILKFSKRKTHKKQGSNVSKDEVGCSKSTNYPGTPRANSIYQQVSKNQWQSRFQKPTIKTSETSFTNQTCLNQSNIRPPVYFAHLPLEMTNSQRSVGSVGSHTARTYEENQKLCRGSQVMNRTEKPLLKDKKKEEIIMNRTEKPLLKDKKKEETKQVKKVQFKMDPDHNIFQISQDEGTLIQGNFLTSKELTCNMVSTHRPTRHKRSNQDKRVTRKVSILDLENSWDDSQGSKENRNKQARFHTFHEMNSIKTITDINRPWITSKTITHLISDGLDQIDSLVHSVGTSSQFSGSQYGGALSSMGRQITTHKRSNTSQQVR